MPVVTLFTNVARAMARDKQVALKLSALSAECLKKPPHYMMTKIQTDEIMSMGGTDDPCAQINIASIGGLTPEMNKNTCRQLTELVSSEYDIEADRIYIDMVDTDRTMIGLSGKMFDEILGPAPK